MEIVFYKSREHPDYYLLYRGANNCNPERMFQKLTATGDFPNSGYFFIDITEVSYILKTDANEKFFDYLAEKVATNHIPNEYDGRNYHAWYEFKNYEPEKWLNDFYAYENRRREEFLKANNISVQTSLF